MNIREVLNEADAVVIGAGAGLSTAAGYVYGGDTFKKYFADFIKKYHFRNEYEGGFYPFESLEEMWAFWSRNIYMNRYMKIPKSTYSDLLDIVKDKDYFVITTNVDHCFQRAGFDKKRLYYTQGDYGLWQCSKPCHDATYENEEQVKKMLLAQGFTFAKDGELLMPEDGAPKMEIPTDLIPRCPKCGEPMSMNLRCDDTFVQDKGWYRAADAYSDFIRRHQNLKVVYLELGVGFNTPVLCSLSAKMKNNKIVRKQPISEYFSISLNYNNERRAA